MNNLSKKMQHRLDAWRKKPTAVIRPHRSSIYVNRREYGDELQEKDPEIWQLDESGKPLYRK